MDGIKAVLLDLDGTVYQSGKLIPGAKSAIERIKNSGRVVRFVTNTTRKPRRAIVEYLSDFGIQAIHNEVITAPVAAATWLKNKNISTAHLVLAKETLEDFSEFNTSHKNPQVVVVGDLGNEWNFEILNTAFQILQNGAQLVAIQKNRFWKDGDNLSLDAGPFVAALEYASGQTATVVGKPSNLFFQSALTSLNIGQHETLVVGDDLESDIGGAQQAGFGGVLVKTGKYQPSDLHNSNIKPDLIIDSIAHLPKVLGIT
jgi:HAD superfamily hydrolase (TIGR01458 family)